MRRIAKITISASLLVSNQVQFGCFDAKRKADVCYCSVNVVSHDLLQVFLLPSSFLQNRRMCFQFLGCVLARPPLYNLQVTLRGTKYEINDVTTVSELKERIKEVSGSSKEHHVLFGGKRLSPSTDLSEAGVVDGAQLSMVPVLTSKTKNSNNNKETSAAATTRIPDGIETTTTSESTSDTANAMREYLQQSGVDTEKLNSLFQGMGGGDGKMPDMGESLEKMSELMSSPLFQEYMSNPEMLEQARQMILNNPMLKNMMVGMPGMAQLLEDPIGELPGICIAATADYVSAGN